ncbi:MAG: hypothetical protein R3B93_17470 [Bacteroidia bacterium]
METTVYINPETSDSISMAHLMVDRNYLDVMNIELLAGNNFPEELLLTTSNLSFSMKFLPGEWVLAKRVTRWKRGVKRSKFMVLKTL